MNRCPDCNAVMKKTETTCMGCGLKIQPKKVNSGRKLFVRAVDVVLYTSLAITLAVLVAPSALTFLPVRPSFTQAVIASIILIVVRSSAQEMTSR